MHIWGYISQLLKFARGYTNIFLKSQKLVNMLLPIKKKGANKYKSINKYALGGKRTFKS